MLNLDRVTLALIDCVNVDRAISSINICEKYAKFGEVKLLTSLDTDYKYAIKIPHIGSIQSYSKFMIRELHKYINTDFVLTAQWDAFILEPKAWTDEYYNYDYIGAPWWFNDNRNVGNGAFSLRSKKYLNVCKDLPIKNHNPEDLILNRTYRNLMLKQGIKYAPEEIAHQFSHEGNAKYGQKWDGSFGYHDNEMTDISAWNAPSEFRVIYRLCNKTMSTHLDGVNKEQCLKNFLDKFNYNNCRSIIFMLDNCTKPLPAAITPDLETMHVSLGNAGSLKAAFEYAMKAFADDDIIYFVEDDYLHLPGSRELIEEGLTKADYVSLYDNSDKYRNDWPNPFIHGGGEDTKVFITKSSHWKYTNSTTQTFACRVRTLKEDKDILYKYNFEGPVPDSFKTFTELIKKGRKVATPIPGRSTHCHSPWETPFINWKEVANNAS